MPVVDWMSIMKREEPSVTTKFNSSLIRHYEDVAHLDKGLHRYFSAETGAEKLLFFGSRHVRDVTDPMFREIYSLADSARPDLMFVEGLQGLRRLAPALQRAELLQDIGSRTVAEVVCRYGERGFAVRYALERSIQVECPEPDFRQEIKHIVRQGFSRDAVIGYYVYRMVHQWLNSPSVPDIETYLKPTIEELRHLTGWNDYDWSFETIASLSEMFWHVRLKLDDPQFYLRGIAPFTTRTDSAATEINHVSAASAFYRDQAIAEEIVSAIGRAKSIFVIFGSGHSFTLEEALKAAFAGEIEA